jgi:hypothetical protein
LEAVINQSSANETVTVYDAEIVVDDGSMITVVEDPGELRFELGVWVSGIEIFLRKFDRTYFDGEGSESANREWQKVFSITYAALIRCAEINNSLRSTLMISNGPTARPPGQDDYFGDISGLSLSLRNAITLNQSILRGGTLGFDAWKSFGLVISDQFRKYSCGMLWAADRSCGEDPFLPEELRILLASEKITDAVRTELRIVVPRFAKVLRSLNIVGQMLRDDEPLKPCLPVFFSVFEQLRELVGYLNGWLTRSTDENSELFGLFDAASYTASLELKKVEFQELIGIASLRSAPAVYARIESAYALLNDNLQQILAGFARLAEPGILPPNVFPEFKLKLDHSLTLRDKLATVVTSVRAAEANPEKPLLEALRGGLESFLAEPIGYLFYKDRETFERFCEEVFAGSEKKDLVPVLHRFAAYLETLFGQVNMRTVLANHPFENKSAN